MFGYMFGTQCVGHVKWDMCKRENKSVWDMSIGTCLGDGWGGGGISQNPKVFKIQMKMAEVRKQVALAQVCKFESLNTVLGMQLLEGRLCNCIYIYMTHIYIYIPIWIAIYIYVYPWIRLSCHIGGFPFNSTMTLSPCPGCNADPLGDPAFGAHRIHYTRDVTSGAISVRFLHFELRCIPLQNRAGGGQKGSL